MTKTRKKIINSPIVGVSVVSPDSDTKVHSDNAKQDSIEAMHEGISRPDVLHGSTYKIKQPSMSSALYITLNDYVINEGTEHESLVPYEVFLNSKNMEHYQWVLALTRTISAMFRKGGDVQFLIDELKSVFDPVGGYWNKGVFIPSIVAEVGIVIERHMLRIGAITKEPLTISQKEFIDSKMAAISDDVKGDDGYPIHATKCSSCSERAVVILDKCAVCLACAESKCG